MSVLTALEEQVQDIAEGNLYYANFVACLAVSEEITSIVSVEVVEGDEELTISDEAISTTKIVTFRVEDGMAGVTYTIKVLVNTSGGNIKALKCKLTIEQSMPTAAWSTLRYHKQQTKLWRTRARFVAVAAGRGSGKTEIARRYIVRALPVKLKWPAAQYFYALPTVAQAKRLAWDKIIELIPNEWVRNTNKTEMRIDTVFGSSLHVFGMDKPQRAEGLQYAGGVIDESSDHRPKVFSKTFRPALSHWNGWCWRVGVPKRFGSGAADFKNFFDHVAEESYTWKSSEILPPEEIASIMETVDERDYNEQFNASWQNAAGQIFYCFDESLHVSTEIEYSPSLPIIVGSDFNVNPMCWTLSHAINGEFYTFDELFLRDTNTRKTLDVLYSRYGQHPGAWQFFGDATARARKTAADDSDYIQIKADTRFKGAAVYYDNSNPRFIHRVASCNAMLKTASGKIRAHVHPRCKRLILDMKERSWAEDSREANDSGDIGHMSDAWGYPVHRKWPIAIEQTSEPQIYMGANQQWYQM